MLNNNNSAGDNANIIKTKGDGNTTTIINNSIDVNLITTVVKGILHDSLPAFQQEAREKVQSSIQDYVDDLINELSVQKTTHKEINNKLPSPDIQYSIYETAKAYAKAPNRASKHTLINLVVQKINTSEEDFDGLTVLDMAIEASSKMNGKQIKYIAFLHYLTNIVMFDTVLPFSSNAPLDPANKSYSKVVGNMYSFHENILRPIKAINDFYINLYTNELIKVFPDGELSKVSMSIPITLGCVTSLQFQRREFISIIKDRTGLDITNQDQAKGLSPLIDRLSLLGGVNDLSQFALTEVGGTVAVAYISTKMRLFNTLV